jgi:protein gp37
MGETTTISWTERTWNPWMGCHAVSPGCDRCYAKADHERRKLPDFGTLRRSKTTFRDPAKWPMAHFIFTCSWSDFFHPHADAWRPEAWAIIREHHRHTYQVLTKRPAAMVTRLPADWGDGWPQVWPGVSVESDDYLGRLEALAETPASVRFFSAEPLLGDLTQLDRVLAKHPGKIHWGIVGGESGVGHRDMPVSWVQRFVDTCRAHGVLPWVKQQADNYPNKLDRIPPELRLHERPLREGQRARPANLGGEP